jgi:Uma2 family endonuclease
MLKTRPQKTLEDYLALPQEHGVELIEGEYAMSPSPGSEHQSVLLNLTHLLLEHVRAKKLGRLFFSPMDVILSQRTVLQPDLLFVRQERVGIIGKRVEGPPDLVVEVLSEGTADRDRFVKRDLYARYGVLEYWIVDPESHTVEVLTLKSAQYELVGIFEQGDRICTPVLPDLALDVDQLWQ